MESECSWLDVPVGRFNEFCLYLNKVGIGYEGVGNTDKVVGLITNKLSEYQESCIKVCYPDVRIR